MKILITIVLIMMGVATLMAQDSMYEIPVSQKGTVYNEKKDCQIKRHFIIASWTYGRITSIPGAKSLSGYDVAYGYKAAFIGDIFYEVAASLKSRQGRVDYKLDNRFSIEANHLSHAVQVSPITIGCRIGKKSGVELLTGVFLSYDYAGEMTESESWSSSGDEKVKISDIDDYSYCDMGVKFGARFFDKHFYLNLEYQRGFLGISDATGKDHSSQMLIGLGVRF